LLDADGAGGAWASFLAAAAAVFGVADTELGLFLNAVSTIT